MKQIDVSDRAFRELQLAARLSGQPVPSLVDRLLDLQAQRDEQQTGAKGVNRGSPGSRPVYVTYKGHRVDAEFDEARESIRVLSGVDSLVGREFKSPSQAAIEVIRALNPNRMRPETNGWRFWIFTDNDKLLESVRHLA